MTDDRGRGGAGSSSPSGRCDPRWTLVNFMGDGPARVCLVPIVVQKSSRSFHDRPDPLRREGTAIANHFIRMNSSRLAIFGTRVASARRMRVGASKTRGDGPPDLRGEARRVESRIPGTEPRGVAGRILRSFGSTGLASLEVGSSFRAPRTIPRGGSETDCGLAMMSLWPSPQALKEVGTSPRSTGIPISSSLSAWQGVFTG
jgi:hypothetical protein